MRPAWSAVNLRRRFKFKLPLANALHLLSLLWPDFGLTPQTGKNIIICVCNWGCYEKNLGTLWTLWPVPFPIIHRLWCPVSCNSTLLRSVLSAIFKTRSKIDCLSEYGLEWYKGRYESQEDLFLRWSIMWGELFLPVMDLSTECSDLFHYSTIRRGSCGTHSHWAFRGL